MADTETKQCPNCGKQTLIEQSGMTFCMSCQQFGGPVVEEFEKVLDQNAAEAEQQASPGTASETTPKVDEEIVDASKRVVGDDVPTFQPDESQVTSVLEKVLPGWTDPQASMKAAGINIEGFGIVRDYYHDNVRLSLQVYPSECKVVLHVLDKTSEAGPQMDMQYGEAGNLEGMLKMIAEKQDTLTPENALEVLTGQKPSEA